MEECERENVYIGERRECNWANKQMRERMKKKVRALSKQMGEEVIE